MLLEHKNISVLFHQRFWFFKNPRIYLTENKHICCLNTKEGTSFWTLLTTKEHLASGNEAMLTWRDYTLIVSMWSQKWAFINEMTPAMFCGTALDIYFCNLWSAEGGMELGNGAVAATVWHVTVSVHWIYDVKFQPWSWTPSLLSSEN